MSIFIKFTKVSSALCVAAAVGWGSYEILRPAYDGPVGIAKGEAYAPVRDTNVSFDIWYPALPGGKAVTVGGNGVFFGTQAGRGAPRREGVFPLVLISHGAGGNAGQFGWIASELANNGYVVVLPNHPGTTSGNASAQAAVRVWERPQDITAILDHMIRHEDEFSYVDFDNIGVVGFSAGGYTALALSGARVDPDRLQRFCDESDHGMSDCAFLSHFGVDLHQLDLSPAAQELRDERVTTGVVVDPGIISTITDESLSTIDIPLFVINLGTNESVPEGVHALDAADRMPSAEHLFIPDATHFSFLAECKERGAEILEKEGELDPLCMDADGRSRGELHNELAQRINSYLDLHTGDSALHAASAETE
ncbi:dienelactone hydrolase family protein [Octadecabacter sp. CECT 8868]|uniref:alpha/beta hydrolase family protein n=1 Tax=Octadecabacter algicola TaxID=2909342 RepID=UPI001F2C820D|nr:alpha/beta fold hydrolase [Octadecabacter algicola]MCF2905619.1 dienelactone hydrolase family protein [Octadecabacter algicola]